MVEEKKFTFKIGTVFILAIILIIGGSLYLENILNENKLSTTLDWPLVFESTPLKADCIFDKELLTNQDAMIIISFEEWWYYDNYLVTLLPSDGLIIHNNINWTGNFTQPILLFYNLSIDTPGYYSISIKITPESGFDRYATDKVNFEVTDSEMIVDSKPFNNWYPSNYGGGVGSQSSFNENLTGNITLSNTPYMNEEVLLVYTFHTSIDILDSERNQLMLFFPPEGFEIIEVVYPPNGEIWVANGEQYIQHTWMGEIRKNETYQLSARFRVIEEGSGNIICSLSAQIQDGIDETLHEKNSVWLSVNKYTATYIISV